VAESRMSQLISLFERALELPEERRAEFLERMPDLALRQELISLLERHESSTDYFDRLAVSVVSPAYAAVLELAPAGLRWEGRRVGAYRLLREVGRGGMSRVFLAERADGQFEQQVALKLLRPGFDSEVDVERFRAERQILASLNHPNIARLLDGGVTDDELPYLVLEYVSGLPFDQHCRAGGLSTRQRLELFLTVADAVEYAHRHSIVHRDLKPSNILVTSDGVIKLLDFGVAKLLQQGVSSAIATTRTAHRWMTPEYAAPEQVLGAPVTPRTDVYQLGAVLYEVLTGGPPFGRQAGSLHDFETAVLTEEPRSLGASLRGDLDAIVSKSLRKSPDARYSSARGLAADVRRYLTGHPVHARRQSSAYRTRRFVIRHRTRLAAVAGVVLLLAVSLTAVRIERARARRAVAAAASGIAAQDSMSGLVGELLAVASPATRVADTGEARRLLQRGLAEARLVSVEPARRARLLEAAGRVHLKLGEHENGFRRFQDALVIRRQLAVSRAADSGMRVQPANAASVAAAAGDPTRRKLLFVRPPGTVFMVDEDGTHEVRITDSAETYTAPAWAPDGRRVLVSRLSGARGIYIVNRDGTGMTQVTAPPSGWTDYTPVTLGNQIIFSRADSAGVPTSYRVNLDGSGLTALTRNVGDGGAVASPKGDLVAFMRGNDIYLLDLRTGVERRLTNTPAQYKGVGGISPDGRKIVFARIDPGRFEQVFVMNIDGTGTRRVSRGDYYDFLPRWSPDGTRIAFTSSRDGTNGVYTMRADGSDVRDVSRTPLTLMMRPGTTVLDVNENLWAWMKY
jgi:tRNA A-37 threonylcarbamoyl transferase component Bud32